jgi:hypothetical protein
MAGSAKTATKTAKSPINGAEIPLGAHPKNTGGKKGRSGRPPGPFKDFLKRLREDPQFHEALEAAAKAPGTKSFGAALKVITDYDEEKPAEKKQIVGPVEVRVRVVREGRRVTAS